MSQSVVRRSRNDKVFTTLRKLSNALVLGGYFVLLNVDLTTGIIIRIISAAMVLPWIIQNKLWDSVGVIGIMTSIDVHKLIQILFF
jgi:hypothetical protein